MSIDIDFSTAPVEQGVTLWEEHYSFIEKTAKSIAYSYWTAEADDVMQEIWVFLWEKEADLIDRGASNAYIKTCIKNVARNYALKMRDSTLAQTDKFYYSFDEVRELLPIMFDGQEAWANAEVPEGAATTTKNDNVEIMCDLHIAYQKLSEAQQSIIYRRYGLGESFEEAKERQQASRALKKMVLSLNTETDKRAKAHDGPGSRKSITRANGIYQSQTAVEG